VLVDWQPQKSSYPTAKTKGPEPEGDCLIVLAMKTYYQQAGTAEGKHERRADSTLAQPESDGRKNLASTLRVQRYLGVSRSTLMRYIADRKIDAIKMDGGWRFRWEDIDRFVQRRTQKAA
jgi:excisionase family DNA binding protein